MPTSRRPTRADTPPPGRPRRRGPVLVLTAGVLAAAAILIGAAHDAAPPAPHLLPADLGKVTLTRDDPGAYDHTMP